MTNEIVYLGHDNNIDLILKADDVAINLGSVTRMTLTLETTLIDSDNGDTDPIRWAKAGYATGEIRLFLGPETLNPGNYVAPLIVYDPTNLEGIVWGNLNISIISEVEAVAP